MYSGGGSYFKAGARRGPKVGESRRRGGSGVRCGEGVWAVSPPLKILNFSISKWCVGVFCGGKFKILVTTKSCKNHILNAWGSRADVTKRKKHLLSFF